MTIRLMFDTEHNMYQIQQFKIEATKVFPSYMMVGFYISELGKKRKY